MSEINERIREIRRVLGLSQAEFSKRIDYSQCYAAELETGRKRVNDRIASLICDRFNVNEEWLETGVGEMFIAPKKLDADLNYVIETYTKLPEAHQRYFLDVLRGLANLGKNPPKEEKEKEHPEG